MKRKLLSLLLIAIFLFSFFACDQSNEINSTDDFWNNLYSSNTSELCSHNWAPATCTEAKTCRLCGETSGIALGHTTETGTCSRCHKNMGTWEKRNYVDEFDNPTGEHFISTTVSGKFSNSATTNSSLTAQIQVDSENISIVLWEYSRNMVKCSYRYDEYSITMLDSSNNKHYISGTMYAGGFRIYIDNSYKSTVLNALQKTGTISFHIVYSEYTTSTYTFSIETSNFNELYSQL